MADLSTILKDPNFVNANPATQQAIFDKWAPQDPNFANANAETQTAIRQKFGIPAITADTGGAPKTAPAAPQQGFFGKVGSGLASLADTTVGSVIPAAIQQVAYPIARPVISLTHKIIGDPLPQNDQAAKLQAVTDKFVSYVDKPFGKFFGVTNTPAYQQEGSRQLMEFVGANIAKGTEWIAKQTGLPVEDVNNMVGSLTLAAPTAIKSAAPTVKNALTTTVDTVAPVAKNALVAVKETPVVQAVAKPLAERAERKAQEASAKDWQRAPQIEAAQAAQRLGVAVNPAEANPNVKTKLLVNATGDALVNAKAAKANAPKWNDLARKDLGLPENTPLTPEAFEKARSAHSAPYDAIKNLGTMQASDDVLGQLNGLKLDPLSTSSPEKAAKVNAVVDRVASQVQTGLSGENVVGQIRGFRRDANQVLKNPNASPIDINVAETNLSIANALENLIEGNIRDPKALSDFRKARTAIAKTYDWESATGVTTKQVDPLQIAKLAEKGKPLTGVLADVANVAGNFPDIANLNLPTEPLMYQRLRRGGFGGTAGFVLGGNPFSAAVGAGLTSLGSEATANMLTRPGMQNRLAIPADRRIPLPTTPVEPMAPIPQNRAVVPYDYSQQSFVPPNFTMVPEQYGPRVGPAPSPIQIQRGLPAPSAEGTMNALRAEDVRRAGVSRAVGQQAEQQAAAAEAAARQPARGGAVLDIDPVTGKMVVGAEGTRGMTPNVQIIESTGKSLSGAADILSSGKSPALMTPEQRIAWEKTKVDLANVVPGMKALNDKAIAAKMQDRAWVQDAIVKAQDQAKAFQDIAARANTEQMRQDALMKREQMMDLLGTLEEQYRQARPVKTGGQGPKTRAHQRNMLRPGDDDIQNALVK